MKTVNFISWIGNLAASVFGDGGLFPSVLMAQAALESGWGQSTLAKLHNNFFGVKAGSNWKGEVVTLPTREVIKGQDVMVNARFRKYANPLDSLKDRNDFLRVNPRYQKAGVFDAKTPEEQALLLQKAKYATDPNYANQLIKLINQHDLKRFDIVGKKKGSLK